MIDDPPYLSLWDAKAKGPVNPIGEAVEPSRLGRILAADGADRWRAEEMGGILRHQLAAPLAADLASELAADEDRSDPPRSAAEGTGDARPTTFGELLHHPNPPVELLRRVKQFAKACKLAGDGPLPGEVATVLYFASIVVARLRCGQQISELGDEAIRNGTAWALSRTWLDQPTRSIFDQAWVAWAAKG